MSAADIRVTSAAKVLAQGTAYRVFERKRQGGGASSACRNSSQIGILRFRLRIKRRCAEQSQAHRNERLAEPCAISARDSSRHESRRSAESVCDLHAANVVIVVGAKQLDEGIGDTLVLGCGQFCSL